MYERFGVGRCCCETECPTWSDNFNREDSEYPGEDWEEVFEDWDIESNQLVERGHHDSICIAWKDLLDERMTASVTTIDETEGNVYRVIVNYLAPTVAADDSSGSQSESSAGSSSSSGPHEGEYYFAELEIGPGGTGCTLRLCRHTGTGSSTLRELENITLFDTTRTFGACITDDTLVGYFNNLGASFCFWVEITGLNEGGHRAGLGNGADQSLTYDDFAMLGHYDGNRRCTPCCPCRCQNHFVPPELTLTYHGTGDCGTLDGISCQLYSLNTSNTFEGTITDGSCLHGLKITVICADEPDDWTIIFDPAGIDDWLHAFCAVGTTHTSDGAESTCDPLNIVWTFNFENPNPRVCPPGCDPCGRAGPALPPPYIYTTYFISVTE